MSVRKIGSIRMIYGPEGSQPVELSVVSRVEFLAVSIYCVPLLTPPYPIWNGRAPHAITILVVLEVLLLIPQTIPSHEPSEMVLVVVPSTAPSERSVQSQKHLGLVGFMLVRSVVKQAPSQQIIGYGGVFDV